MALTSINIAGVLGTAKHRLLAAASLVGLFGGGAAQAGEGLAKPWQLGLQDAATPVAEFIHSFHDGLLITITVITLFVLALLVIIVAKFNAKANPVPSKTTHHVGLEIAWTLIPVLILVVIAIPSFRLLKQQIAAPPADLTIKLTGNAWYWKFEYPKDAGGGFEFDVRMMTESDIAEAVKAGKGKKEDYHRLLSVDNEAVVPVNKNIVVQVTSADVLHAFAVQPFGVKVDAVPGRLNQTWFRATKEGVYYGQCQELCGKDHAFMPLAIRVVSEEKYKAWLAEAKKKFASTDPAVRTADNTVSTR